ncbi:MAG: toprim domain-containing protein, partial [Candidatus ainarchaeum sp.]|nr:toprim domain-containing protein [Candidatus ainarchaeum sp.]
MILIISEKPIAGERIASILSGGKFQSLGDRRSPSFVFEASGKQFTLVPLKGHVRDVDFPVQYMNWIGTDLRNLVNAKINYIDTEKEIVSLLKKVAPAAEKIIIATDADREGESIGLEAVNAVKSVNPNVKIERASFSAITPKDINPAFEKTAAFDYNLANSADSRREIDLVWGAVLTRFLSIVSGKLGKEFLSMGRVQGPSVDYYEDIVVKDKNGLIAIVKIGDFVEQFEGNAFETIGDCRVFDAKNSGCSALSFNLKTLKTEFKPITAVVKHRHLGNLFEITLETGRKVKITGSHSVFVLRDGEIQIVVGEELRKGDFVVAPKNTPENNCAESMNLLQEFLKLDEKIKSRLFVSPAFEKKWVVLTQKGREFLRQKRLEKKLIVHKSRFASSTVSQWETGGKKKASYKLLCDYLSILDYDIDLFLDRAFGELFMPWREVVKLSSIEKLKDIHLSPNARIYCGDLRNSLPIFLHFSPELMRLLGYYLSEGCCSDGNSALSFGKGEEILARDAAKCIKTVFFYTPKVSAKKSTLIANFGGALGKLFFESVFEIGKGAKNKRIPRVIFNVSDDLKKEFLKGYFEGDGHFSKAGQLEACTVSERLASDLLYLLSQFGVIATVQRNVNKSPCQNSGVPTPRTRFNVKISGKVVLSKLSDIVPERQRERLENYLADSQTRCGYDG